MLSRRMTSNFRWCCSLRTSMCRDAPCWTPTAKKEKKNQMHATYSLSCRNVQSGGWIYSLEGGRSQKASLKGTRACGSGHRSLKSGGGSSREARALQTGNAGYRCGAMSRGPWGPKPDIFRVHRSVRDWGRVRKTGSRG